jgi:hypothetical protein
MDAQHVPQRPDAGNGDSSRSHARLFDLGDRGRVALSIQVRLAANDPEDAGSQLNSPALTAALSLGSSIAACASLGLRRGRAFETGAQLSALLFLFGQSMETLLPSRGLWSSALSRARATVHRTSP